MFKYTKTACSIGSTQSNENFNRVVSAKTQYTFMLRFRKYFIPCCSNCCSEKIRTGVIIKNMFFLKMFSRLYIILEILMYYTCMYNIPVDFSYWSCSREYCLFLENVRPHMLEKWIGKEIMKKLEETGLSSRGWAIRTKGNTSR